MSNPILLSVVTPVYGTPELIPVLCDRLHDTLCSITQEYEIILVFDCSPDEGWDRIAEECRKDPRVRGIKLSRNFGQHYAITAGLQQRSSSMWVVVMDCDLQDRPEEIPRLYQTALEKKADLVFAQRQLRGDSRIKKLSSSLFHRGFSYLAGVSSDASIGNFGMYSNQAIDAYLAMGDQIRCFSIMMQWVGFRSTSCPVQHDQRLRGKSTYTWSRLFELAANTALSFSDKPLHLTIRVGIAICILSAIMAVWTLCKYFFGGILVSGYTSLILSIWFLSGVNLFVVGVVGLYVGKIFDQTKSRPAYIIAEQLNPKKEC